MMAERLFPFAQSSQLSYDLENMNDQTSDGESHTCPLLLHLPGYPQIELNDPIQLTNFLEKDLCAPDLEAMAPYLWMMSTQSSANVNALHCQKVRGRNIIITEDPRLHLVWIYDRIFIKPVPQYLLSHAFWNTFLLSKSSPLGNRRESIRKAALGYLRTYDHLIRHESDFRIAQQEDLCLIPEQAQWPQFCAFTSEFNSIRDSDVSARYSYGELRLTRLNFYIKILLHKFHFEQVHGQYEPYFSRFYASFLFIFAIISILLNSMQVELAVEPLGVVRWRSFWQICRYFSVLAMAIATFLSLAFISILIWKISDEWIFAIRVRRKRRVTTDV
jgi:hypothetical protein